MELAPIELSESAMRDVARRHLSDPHAALDALEAAMWRRAGVHAEPAFSLDLPGPALDEPHALGWLHQYLVADARAESFARHTGHESKHESSTVSTQLFTPRWIADWLIVECFEHAPSDATVLDPACGAGQMLLAAIDWKIRAGVEPGAAFEQVRGIELDPAVAEVCRATLKLAAGRALGQRSEVLERTIDANIVVGDGLFDPIEPADVVVTNPPYMGSRSMPPELKERLRERYPLAFHDLYLAFVERCARLCRHASGILAQQTLWYLKRFEPLRRELSKRGSLSAVAHLGHNAFAALQGEKATVMAWVWVPHSHYETRFYDVRAARSAAAKREALLDTPPVVRPRTYFDPIPGAPLAFWLPSQTIAAFEAGPRLGDIADIPGRQNKTGNNAKYVRAVSEVPASEIRRAPGLHNEGPEAARWVFYSKGGRHAPWWGNWDWIVDWSPAARAFYASNRTSNLLPEEYWFREGLCYSDFGGKRFNARWMPPGCVFDMAGPAIFVEDDDSDVLAALLVVLNSSVAREILNALNPTLHYQVRDVRNLAIPFWSPEIIARLAPLGHRLVAAARAGESLEDLERQADRIVSDAYES